MQSYPADEKSSLKGSHASNIYISDLENLATASRRLWITPATVERVMAECTILLYVGRL